MPYAGKIYYEVIDLVAPWEPARETILFHHGIGASAGIWQEWLPALIERYRIVRFDMRGYGRSHIPARGEKWSSGVFIDDLLAVADAVGAERPHLVGESIGGTIRSASRPSRSATAPTAARPCKRCTSGKSNLTATA